jgi:glyoxylase-like metal-dependent hydrolase (beta-lactamase superfamily II)
MGLQEPTQVVPGVYRLGADWVNWYLVEDEGSLTAVDAGLGGMGKTFEADLAAIGVKPQDVSAVVLTHSDTDHTGLAPRMQQAGSEVWVHQDDADTLRRPRPKGGDASVRHLLPRLVNPRVWALMGKMISLGGRPTGVQDGRTFGDGDVLDVPGHPRVIHTPGHTPGHCVIHFEKHGALFVGDELCTWNLLNDRRGPQVMPTPLNLSTDGCFESLAAVEGVDASVVLPGHGEPYHDSPATAVAKARAAGRS